MKKSKFEIEKIKIENEADSKNLRIDQSGARLSASEPLIGRKVLVESRSSRYSTRKTDLKLELRQKYFFYPIKSTPPVLIGGLQFNVTLMDVTSVTLTLGLPGMPVGSDFLTSDFVVKVSSTINGWLEPTLFLAEILEKGKIFANYFTVVSRHIRQTSGVYPT